MDVACCRIVSTGKIQMARVCGGDGGSRLETNERLRKSVLGVWLHFNKIDRSTLEVWVILMILVVMLKIIPSRKILRRQQDCNRALFMLSSCWSSAWVVGIVGGWMCAFWHLVGCQISSRNTQRVVLILKEEVKPRCLEMNWSTNYSLSRLPFSTNTLKVVRFSTKPEGKTAENNLSLKMTAN